MENTVDVESSTREDHQSPTPLSQDAIFWLAPDGWVLDANPVAQSWFQVQSSPDPVIYFSSLFNSQSCKDIDKLLAGIKPGECASINLLVPPRIRDRHPNLREQFFQAPQARAMGAGRDLSAYRKDGSEVPVEIGLNPVYTAEGQFVVASVVDITERKKAQRSLENINVQLQQKNQEMEQFIYTVSHDLKSPLVTIDGFAESLETSLGTTLNDEQRHYLKRIRGNVDKMGGLLNDLLQLSRVIRQSLNFNTFKNKLCEIHQYWSATTELPITP